MAGSDNLAFLTREHQKVVAGLREEIDSLRTINSDLTLQVVRGENTDALGDLKRALEEANAALCERDEKLKLQEQDYQNQLQELTSQVEALKASKESEISALNQELNCTKEAHEAKLSELHELVEKLESENESLKNVAARIELKSAGNIESNIHVKAIRRKTLPDNLRVIAVEDDGEPIQNIRRQLPQYPSPVPPIHPPPTRFSRRSHIHVAK